MKSAGQLAYERDVARRPTYHDGTPRLTWDQLCPLAKNAWARQRDVSTDDLHAKDGISPSRAMP